MCLLYHITENVRKYKMIKKLDFSVSRKIFTHTTVKLGAAKYNGGGHKFASGCRTSDYKVIEALAKDLDAACKAYNDEENI